MRLFRFNGTVWRQRNPATVPSPGAGAFQMAYDAVNHLAVFFGGEATTGTPPFPRDTWAWNGTDWKKLNPPTAPLATTDFAFAYFPERSGLVMHGGWGDPDWRFRTNTWLLRIQSAPTGVIRFTRIQPLGAQLTLTSTGYVQAGRSQVLQASTNLAISNAWANALINPAPAATNLWTVPLDGREKYFRILELP